jgi:hypothetical protein
MPIPAYRISVIPLTQLDLLKIVLTRTTFKDGVTHVSTYTNKKVKGQRSLSNSITQGWYARSVTIGTRNTTGLNEKLTHSMKYNCTQTDVVCDFFLDRVV